LPSFLTRMAEQPGRSRPRSLVFLVTLLVGLHAGPARAETTFLISGRGYGHGVGLSQYGAQGYARHGWDYRRILRHYYPGTALAHVDGTPVVRVLLRDGESGVVISSSSSFRLTDGSGGTLLLPAGRYVFGGQGVVTVASARYRLRLPLRFDPIASPLAVDGLRYRGSLTVGSGGEGLYVVNDVELDDYVRGVVAWEMLSNWLAQALRAQAVAARSYALAERKPDRLFDLYPDTRSQMYGGIRAETNATNAAVAATAGVIVTWRHHVAYTFFSSTSGGCTAALGDGMPGAQSLPYLISVPDPYDRIAPEHAWGPLAVSAGRLSAVFGVPAVRSVRLVRNGSARVAEVIFATDGGERTISGEEFARALGLRSTWFAISTPGGRPVSLRSCSARGETSPLPPPARRAPPDSAASGASARQPNPRLGRVTPADRVISTRRFRILTPIQIAAVAVGLVIAALLIHGFQLGPELRLLALLALAAALSAIAVAEWLPSGTQRPTALGPERRPSPNERAPTTAAPLAPHRSLIPTAPNAPLPQVSIGPTPMPQPTHPLQQLPAETGAAGSGGASGTSAATPAPSRPRSGHTSRGRNGQPTNPTQPPPPGPLVIRNLEVEQDSGLGTVTVSWQTSLPTMTDGSSGFYGPTIWTPSDSGVTEHRTVFDDLAPATDYRLAVEAVDAWGRTQSDHFSVTTAPSTGPPALQASGGVFSLNARPFFPIAIWSACPDVVNATLAEGVNLFMGNACDSIEQLTAQIGTRGLTVVDPSSHDTASNVVGWYYPDEWDAQLPDNPSPSLLDAVARGPDTQLSFLTLTNHFYSQAAPLPQGRGMYPLLAATAGVLGFDLYPLQSWCNNDAFAHVYGAQRELVQLAASKPTYQWIETAPMEHCAEADLAPTAQTVRAETWLAIAGGAAAIGYFPYYWTSQIGNEISQTDNEIKELTPALLAQPTVASADAPTIKVSAHTLNGALYLIAVNASRDPVETTLHLPDLNGRQLQVYDENRTLASSGSDFTDAFDPLQVHIYIAAPALDPDAAAQPPPTQDSMTEQQTATGCDCGLRPH
jgi:stage II sporulation protein D